MTDYGPLIHAIREWDKAYPLSVFPEPPRHEHGRTIDTCSARMGRHVIGRLIEIIEACEAKDCEPEYCVRIDGTWVHKHGCTVH